MFNKYILQVSLLIGVGIFINRSLWIESVKIQYTDKDKKVSYKTQERELKHGDLIFQTSLSNQSLAIQIATDSKYSHVGIIYKEGQDFFVYEAAKSVQLTPLHIWIARGENKKFVVKRWNQSSKFLTKEGIKKMKMIGEKYLGKEYDLKFEWSNDRIYCSELVWKIYKETFDVEIGQLERIKDLNLSSETVRTKLKERYGNTIPMEELIITPDRMFKSKKIGVITSN
ncbi:YiiX family permuted papain-like enzyme [Aquimarina addita]